MSAPICRTGGALALLAVVAALLAAASAGASAPPKFRVDLFVSSTDKANLEQPGFPDRCKSWTQGRSALNYEIEAASPFNMALVRNGLTDAVFALIPRQPVWMTDTSRTWQTRSHVMDNTAECQPCGPSSELGLCSGALPDRRDGDRCDGDGRRRRGTLALTVGGGALTVTGAPAADLSRCRAPREPVVPMFSGNPRFAPVNLPGAVGRLLRLKVGERTRIERVVRRGDCKRLRGPGLRTCSERYVLIRATRFG